MFILQSCGINFRPVTDLKLKLCEGLGIRRYCYDWRKALYRWLGEKKLFPISVFMAFAIFTTIQMKILGQSIDAESIPKSNKIAIFVVWPLLVAGFTLWTNHQIMLHYQKPIKEFSEVVQKVTSGDFSVYLALHYTADKLTHLDVLFTDFNKMVEELGSIETLKTADLGTVILLIL